MKNLRINSLEILCIFLFQSDYFVHNCLNNQNNTSFITFRFSYSLFTKSSANEFVLKQESVLISTVTYKQSFINGDTNTGPVGGSTSLGLSNEDPIGEVDKPLTTIHEWLKRAWILPCWSSN